MIKRPWTPAYFTAVMGTGILASSTHTLPMIAGPLAPLATVMWIIDCALLVAVTGTGIAFYTRDLSRLERHLLDPATAPFFGAAAMGILSAGNATLVVGADMIGVPAARAVDLALWFAGTVVGVLAAAAVPMLAFTRHRVPTNAASPVWLLPVVAPMVSAATGAQLIDHVSPHAGRLLALACFAQFGATSLAAVLVVAAVWSRLALHGHVDPNAAPSLLIVLGPLGQSVTTAVALALHAPTSLGVDRDTLTAFALLFGVPVMGFALLWIAIAVGILIDSTRKGIDFSLGWWAFTFPVGTCVTGATGLAGLTHEGLVSWLAVALWFALATGWTLAATGTMRWLTAPHKPQLSLSIPARRLSREGRKGPSYTRAV